MAKRKVNELNTCNQFCGDGGCEIGIRRSIVEFTESVDDQQIDYMDYKQRRAQLLYCMDVLMHALNDEEACVPWLCA